MFNPINAYLTDPDNKELEIRFKINDIALFQSIYTELEKESNIEEIQKSVIILTPSGRKEIYFGKTREEKYVKKTQGRYWFAEQRAYKLAESSEIEVDPFRVDDATIIRIRFRSSLQIKNLENWRFDFTLVKQIDRSELQNLPKYKKQMLEGETNFLKAISSLKTSIIGLTCELEAEYIGGISTKASPDAQNIANDVKNLVSVIAKASGEESLEENSLLQNVIYEVASALLQRYADPWMINRFKSHFGLKEISNNPISLTKTEYFDKILPNIQDYFVAEKTDGLRCFIVLNSEQGPAIVLTATDVIEIDIGKSKHKNLTVLDAELTDFENPPKIKIFDTLMVDGNNITNLTFAERYLEIPKAIEGLSNNVKIKKMTRLTEKSYQKEITTLLKITKNVDGLVFTPAINNSIKQRYKSTNNYFDMKVFKFKDSKHSTIDFLIKEIPKNLIGKKPFINPGKGTLYALFSGITLSDKHALNIELLPGYNEILSDVVYSDKYFPIQFAPSIHPTAFIWESKAGLSGEIGEFLYEGTAPFGKWKLERIREDKQAGLKKGISFGNNFRVAESTMFQLLNPLTSSDLTSKPEKNEYFVKIASDEFKPLTKLNNFVKSTLIKQLTNKNLVIDLASGKGQDLFTYNCFGIKNLLCLDIDVNALEELNRRRYLMNNKGVCVYNAKPTTNVKSLVAKMDLSKPADENQLIIDNMIQGAADGIVMNLAIHYIIKDDSTLENFIKLISKNLMSKGIFIFTTFDGAKIFKLLENVKTNQTWDLGRTDDNATKYSIKKEYSDLKFKHGLKIGVKHHFSNDLYYEESLVDIEYVISAFEKKGFKMFKYSSFGDLHKEFSQFNRTVYSKLSKDDLLYSSLYSFVAIIRSD
jgi:mRNA capping family enzyme